ncbi:MAG: PmoA family protein [Verrucomicrobiales bacterium]|nr:PmoA family protein [Verrucomicrobiales bacterium]
MNTLRILALFLFISGATAQAIELEVSAGKTDRPVGSIMSAMVTGLPEGTRSASIEPGGATGQVENGDSGQLFWRLAEPLNAGETKRFIITPVKAKGEMKCIETTEVIQLQQSGRNILEFRKAPSSEAAKHASYYTRTGYIHPLWTPLGKVVTGDYPIDHVHQHALFFAWTKTEFEGKKTEFWNQKLEKGRISYQSTETTADGVCFAGFSARNLYEDISNSESFQPVLNETWTVRAWHKLPGENFQIVDLSIVQKCAGESPLTIEKYHYGGMTIRGNSDWLAPSKKDPPPAQFLTSEGFSRENGNHSRPEWVAMHGPLDGGHAAVTIMAHPENFRHPQHVRLHPSKPYFVFTPMVEKAFQITPEKPWKANFRLVISDGKPDTDLLETIRQNYAEPTRAKQL